ncbi:MAG: type II toxin-antitoxin system PemK/MazF family toxin [Planctomycetota bacterium]|nr:type II toxin-antitoxin system PemK/MazF family toxin [Planctomycetota bacterium]
MPAYQPDRGDLIYLDFTPHAGTEQGGHRPALVLSHRDFNIATGLAFVCPITSKVKGGSFEVPLPRGTKISGVILSDQIRSLDWIARDATFHSKATEEVMCEVLGRIEAIMSIDC